MKENTLNKLKEEDARKHSTKEDGVPLNKLIGWRPNYEKPKEHTNKLR